MGYSPWDCKEADTTERLTLSLFSAVAHFGIFDVGACPVHGWIFSWNPGL